ncbi:MAG: hypothetical protein Q8K96_11080 [Rubrivivax sp.]|nr:hypothetical protein [Rubrivivax sp.]
MITLQHAPILAVLVGALVLGMHPPVQAQSTGSDGALAQIEAMMTARASATDTATAQAFDTALQDYERCHWLLAFEQLVRLADRDHEHAARMAMQMHRYGPGLYGQAFALSPGQVERYARVQWQAQVTQATGAR